MIILLLIAADIESTINTINIVTTSTVPARGKSLNLNWLINSAPTPPAPTPIEKIEFTRIASEEKRKVAELELEARKLKAETAEAILGFETKIKEMELKYNTQVDAAKIKADADLEKLVTSNRNKTFLAAQASSDRLDQQVSNLDGQQRTSQTPGGVEPGEQS